MIPERAVSLTSYMCMCASIADIYFDGRKSIADKLRPGCSTVRNAVWKVR